MPFSNIHLLPEEKRSLFSFRFKKKQREEEIKCYATLYFTYKFIKQNFLDERDEDGEKMFAGTYSLSDNYRRYKIYVRKKRLTNLPNWIAIIISLITLLLNLPILATGLLPALRELGLLP